MRKALLFLTILPVALANIACEKGLAWGDHNAVIVVAPRDWWPELEDSLQAVLSPTIVTVREERTFRVTLQDPTEATWPRLRKFREEIVIGSPSDPWVAAALATLDQDVEIAPPQILETEDVWAKGQNVTIILVDPEGNIPYQVFFRLADVHTLLTERFVRESRERMFFTGRDTALVDSLQDLGGFSLLVPMVYDWGREDSVFVFRNDNPSPSELIRQFSVTWRQPATLNLDSDSLLDWRREVSERAYTYPQVVERETVTTGFPMARGAEIFELRGTWRNPPETAWPAAGPFIVWGVHCPHQDRLYLIDAWLYAPGVDKWEYMIQLETILSTFRCGSVQAI
jgi:hypothetical protein